MAEKIDFDQYAQDYEKILKNQLNFFDGNTDYFAEYKVQTICEQIQKRPQNILEYGCGTGRNLRFLIKMFPGSNIYGCDISQKSLAIASRNAPGAHLFQNSTNDKDEHIEHFDLIFLAGVMHHIPPSSRANSLSLLKKWLNRNGEMFVFEHNPYNPVTRHLVNSCPYDKDAVLLEPKELKSLFLKHGFKILSIKYALFFPSFLKRLRPLEKRLAYLPLGGQYYIQTIKDLS